MTFKNKILIIAVFSVVSLNQTLAADTATTTVDKQRAIFAGGCFWCMEPPFDKLDGVMSTTSGYTGGHKDNPTYKEVSSGDTGHAEVIEVVYDPAKISYQDLLDVFWVNIDPLNGQGQFCDYGTQYRSEIFYLNEVQRQQATQSLEKVREKLGKPVFTRVTAAKQFYPAEEYHQDYYQVNPVRYNYYRWACGRDARLKELWGDRASH